MRRLAPLVAVAFIASVGSSGGGLAQQAGNGIPWDASRPLEWSDFRGPVDPDAPPTAAALTSASVSLGYELEVRRNRRCEFEITKVETAAKFHPENSWVRDEARIDAVLEHEQGHFDLSEVFRSMLEREAGRLVGEPRRCPAGADMPAIEAEVGELVDDVREPIFDALGRVQAEYDAETGHGMLRGAQREWTTRIGDALRRGRW